MNGENQADDKHGNPVKDYYVTLRSYIPFIKTQFIRAFFGKYRNTYIGFLWNFLTPLIYIILLYIVSTEIRGSGPERIIMIISGVALYHVLVSGITSGTTHFTGSASLIKKMYFPREILVYIHTGIKVLVMLILYGVLAIAILVLGYGFNPVALLYFPIIVVLGSLFSIGCALALSSITVYVRDIQYAVSSINLIFFVTTPLRGSLYEFEGLRGELMWCNPFSYFIEPLHQIFYFKAVPDPYFIGMELLFTLTSLLIGTLVFKKLRHGFAERL